LTDHVRQQDFSERMNVLRHQQFVDNMSGHFGKGSIRRRKDRRILEALDRRNQARSLEELDKGTQRGSLDRNRHGVLHLLQDGKLLKRW
jgi:hypothetical protein